MEFKEFQDFDLQQLQTLQVKLTYVGSQKKPIPTVAFTSHFNVLDMEKFRPFRRDGFDYGNDDIAVWTFTCSPEELQRITKSAGEIQVVRRGEVIGEFLSFMMLNTTLRGDRVHEAILDAETSRLLLEKLRAALEPGNTQGIETFDQLMQILF
ncbi:MAG: hypothetical protein FJ008_01990 [Chloroflexi bacterium]|nr:hypothetical protein [Chloroflexota bacterium]MBM3154086.1 hypothetical protein [Chloroflexota bacterium]MBM3172541.1 hypothetical protein [Chloroflexota bacterium]MBM3175056.1 hypothetical protein [Chloroflexota bacterium]MBM4450917.1 hypothetical protein [Chloroflexota bacterium]